MNAIPSRICRSCGSPAKVNPCWWDARKGAAKGELMATCVREEMEARQAEEAARQAQIAMVRRDALAAHLESLALRADRWRGAFFAGSVVAFTGGMLVALWLTGKLV